MTSTPVKNADRIMMLQSSVQAGKNALSAGGFQDVWNSRTNRGTDNNPSGGSAAKTADRQIERGASLRAKENRPAESSDAEQTQELTPEEQEKAMEVLNAAAWQLMEQLADTLGISMEELQKLMGEMELEPTDLLNASELGALLLKAGGAEDSYALLTDGELYENYRMMMERLKEVLQESADALGTEPEQLTGLLEEGLEAGITAEEESVPVQQTPVREEAAQPGEEPEGENIASADSVTNVVEEGSETRDGARSGGEEKHSGEKSGKEEPMNLFAQNLRMEQLHPELGRAGEVSPSSPWSPATQEIMDQIMDYMKLHLNADTTSLEMQLHPASLGTLQVQIAAKAGMITANFITQNEAVKAALESQMVQLKEQFEEQGVKIEAIEVTVQTHEFERNLDEQGRGRNGQEPERRSRTRRINLNDPLVAEELEEEDAAVAEMMAADGRTVDYAV